MAKEIGGGVGVVAVGPTSATTFFGSWGERNEEEKKAEIKSGPSQPETEKNLALAKGCRPFRANLFQYPVLRANVALQGGKRAREAAGVVWLRIRWDWEVGLQICKNRHGPKAWNLCR